MTRCSPGKRDCTVFDVIQRGQRLDDLHVGLVFLEFLRADGQRNGIHTQPGTGVSLIGFDVVDAQAQTAAHRDEIPQIRAAFQLHVDFKVVGAVFQVRFKGREAREDTEQENVHDQRQGIQPRAGGEAQNAAAHQSRRGGQSLDLPPGGIENGIGADGGDGQQRCRRQQRQLAAQKHVYVLIQQHGHRGGEGRKHEGAQTGAVPLAGALTADGGRQRHDQRDAQECRAEIQSRAPGTKQTRNGILYGQ